MPPTTNEPTHDEPVGAHPIGPPPRKSPAWLVPLVLLVVAAVVLSLLLSRCGNDSDGDTASTPVNTAATMTPSQSASAAGVGVAAGDAGTLFAGDEPVLPMAAATRLGSEGSLAEYSGQDATATAISVQSVPADEGFWVGSGADDRVWIQLTGKAGESKYEVKQGDRVSFTGKVTENSAGFAERAGVTDAEGQKMLDQQGQHVDVAKSDLELSQ